jgi:hypothetical protein
MREPSVSLPVVFLWLLTTHRFDDRAPVD